MSLSRYISLLPEAITYTFLMPQVKFTCYCNPYKWNNIKYAYLCLVSFNQQMSMRVNHEVVNISSQFFKFFLWIVFHYVNKSEFVYSFSSWHTFQYSYQFMAVKRQYNHFYASLWWRYISILFVKYPMTLCHRVVVCLLYTKYLTTSNVVLLFYTPI